MKKLLGIIAVAAAILTGCSAFLPQNAEDDGGRRNEYTTRSQITETVTEAETEHETETETEPETVQETLPPETTAVPETAAPVTMAPETVPTWENTENLVWIPTNGGKKYHRNPGCSGMKNPEQVPESSAVAQGYGRCKKCYK